MPRAMLWIARTVPLRRFIPFALAILALAVLGVGELGRVGGASAVIWWADAGWTFCSIAAVAGCLVAARRDRISRPAWLLFAAGCASWLLGQIAWDYYQLVARQTPPSPSFGDAGWLGFVPLFGAGLYFLPRRSQRGRGARKALFALDVVIVAIALTLVGVIADQDLLIASTSVTTAGKAVALAYPISYLTLGLAAFLLVVRVPQLAAARGMALLLLGLFCEGAGFVAWTPLILGGTYRDGAPLDLVWMTGLLAIALAGLEWRPARRRPAARAADVPARALVALGLVPTLLGLGVALVAPAFVHGPVQRLIAPGISLLIALIGLRQFGAIVENARLYRTAATQRELARQRAERLRRVQEMGQALRLDLDTAGISQLVVETACAALGYRIAVLNLITNPDAADAQRRIRAIATTGLPPEMDAHFRANDAPASDILRLLDERFRLSRSYYIPSGSAPDVFEGTTIPVWTPPLTATAKDGWRPGDELFIPLAERRTNRFLGFLSLDDPIDGRRPDREGVEMLEILADHAALAIENGRLFEQAQRQALRDPVTDLANHRAMHQALDAALAPIDGERDDAGHDGAARAAFLLLDVDNFKLFNDTYGHPTGDAVLRLVAGQLRDCLRAGDLAGRYGGDEFAAILPHSGRAEAEGIACRLAQAVAATPYVAEDGTIIPLTVSIGVAAAPEDGHTRQALLAVADARMYAIKHGASSDPVLIRDAADLLGETAFGVLEGLVAAVDAKDRYTREHSLDVTRYALMLAGALGLSEAERHTLAVAGPLHDVGKIAVPDRILRKPGGLTDEEYAAIKAHVTYGVAIVRGLLDDRAVLDTIAHHHERYDGRGYPAGIHGNDTPLLSRIMQIADAVSAMMLDRPYRRGLPAERVVAELRRGAGAQFDPALVEPFITAFIAAQATTTVAGRRFAPQPTSVPMAQAS